MIENAKVLGPPRKQRTEVYKYIHDIYIYDKPLHDAAAVVRILFLQIHRLFAALTSRVELAQHHQDLFRQVSAALLSIPSSNLRLATS